MLNNQLHKELGTLGIEVKFNKDGTISGSIGDAQFKNAKLSQSNYGFELKTELNNWVKESYRLDKDRLVVLFVFPEKSDSTLKQSDANFHLKSNFFFDFTMKVGGVKLIKVA